MSDRTHRVRVIEQGNDLLVLGVPEITPASKLLPEDVRRNGWGGSFAAHWCRRGNEKTRRWQSRTEDQLGYPLPKDAIPGVLFTNVKRDPA